MVARMFDPVVIIEDGASAPLLDTTKFPYLYNEGGRGVQLPTPHGTEISIEPDDPGLEAGISYTGIGNTPKKVETVGDHFYEITLFDFGAAEVRYAPLEATRANARAFGMTLLKSGECVRFEYQGLKMADYVYGKWAGHMSPYIERSRRQQLLTINPSDFEYHDFAHVFFSRDSVPLVISVARWRPYANEIALADLWLQPGDALVLPPKVKPAPPTCDMQGEALRRIVLDLHGNRNSALACWPDQDKATLSTTTILAIDEVMQAEATKPHYHEEPAGTVHEGLASTQTKPQPQPQPQHI
ncbi:MAG: hypothetical protein V4857_29970 [Pseudomonadota bacterium]